jgi:isoleucyl-tRNA synthetase
MKCVLVISFSDTEILISLSLSFNARLIGASLDAHIELVVYDESLWSALDELTLNSAELADVLVTSRVTLRRPIPDESTHLSQNSAHSLQSGEATVSESGDKVHLTVSSTAFGAGDEVSSSARSTTTTTTTTKSLALEIVVRAADGQKCPRCWKYTTAGESTCTRPSVCPQHLK